MAGKSSDRPMEVKSVSTYIWEGKEGDADLGIVEHLISVYGVEDLGQDICHPGCFAKTLQERKTDVRVLDMHRRRSTSDALGVPLDIWEVGREELPEEVLGMYPEATGGVKARTQFLLETPEGKGAYVRLKTGAVTEFSFAYDALDYDYESKSGGGRVRNLRTIRLHEYGPTLFGMMPGARAISAKSVEEEDPETEEDWGSYGEKVVDVTENTIQIRVRDSGAFQEGSIRTIPISKEQGIKARIGRLKGKASTTIQAYIFDKGKWTTERARKWVNDHKKALIIFVPEEKEDTEEYETKYWYTCQSCGHKVHQDHEDTNRKCPKCGGKLVRQKAAEEEGDAEPGGPTKCVCPKCGHLQAKVRGEPCCSQKCPKCGTVLVAKTEGEDDEEDGKGKSLSAQDQAKLQILEIEQQQLKLTLAEAGPAD